MDTPRPTPQPYSTTEHGQALRAWAFSRGPAISKQISTVAIKGLFEEIEALQARAEAAEEAAG